MLVKGNLSVWQIWRNLSGVKALIDDLATAVCFAVDLDLDMQCSTESVRVKKWLHYSGKQGVLSMKRCYQLAYQEATADC